MTHNFHIPVLGLAFSIDTPLKVARFGISSVVSIVDDELIERMREYHLKQNNRQYNPILKNEEDYRAKRITSYLDLLNDLINEQVKKIKNEAFEKGSELTKYFELLPEHSAIKKLYSGLKQVSSKEQKDELVAKLKNSIKAGAIEVNIMAKVDKINFSKAGDNLGEQFSDALAALRGFANSKLNSSLILSAGMNPRLYNYLTEFEDFFPKTASASKKIILKVSDFRSAFIQAKFLAKKGIWVHEFRIESGLNCGGHAFATEGYLLGPILQEFKERRTEMITELNELYVKAMAERNILEIELPKTRFTVQGGIGSHEENEFLINHYKLDGTGWGSPFLLVPEATNVDEKTLDLLQNATSTDFYVSGASPLGIPFNDFRKSSSEQQRLDRIAAGRPGSPCTKKFLVSNTEFTEQPICTASRKYQNLKIKELKAKEVSKEAYDQEFDKIVEKACLCEGLAASVYVKNDMLKKKESDAVSICPGPNTAYFNRSYTLNEMVNHIYGKINLLEGIKRPNMYINELKLYISYLNKEVETNLQEWNNKSAKRLEKFKNQLIQGIEYYENILPDLKKQINLSTNDISTDLEAFKSQVLAISIPKVQLE